VLAALLHCDLLPDPTVTVYLFDPVLQINQGRPQAPTKPSLRSGNRWFSSSPAASRASTSPRA
jgi:hypothetical protein